MNALRLSVWDLGCPRSTTMKPLFHPLWIWGWRKRMPTIIRPSDVLKRRFRVSGVTVARVSISLNFPRVLLAALNNGLDTESGESFFPGTGSLPDFEDFEKCMTAWENQVRHYAEAGIAIDAAIRSYPYGGSPGSTLFRLYR